MPTPQQKTKQWARQHTHDEFVKKSKHDGYRSRAAYKLEEIAQDHQLFKNVTNILDLGCAPGSWSQFVLNKTPNTRVVGVDLLEIDPIQNKRFNFIQGDFTDQETQNRILQTFYDANNRSIELIMSDMSPNLTGNAHVDQAKMEDLAIQVLDYCKLIIEQNNNVCESAHLSCLIKLFHGMHFNNVVKYANTIFNHVKTIKPKASRDKSRECYLLMRP